MLRASAETEEPRPERDADRARFLADAAALLAAEATPSHVYARLARLAVPALGDWAAVEPVGSDGKPGVRALAHLAEVDGSALEQLLAGPSPESWPRRDGVERRVARGLDPARACGDAEEAELVRRVGARSLLVLPLAGRDRLHGRLVAGAGESGRFGGEDLELASALAAIATMVLDGAMLLEGERRARAEAERAVDRTRRLQEAAAALSEAVTAHDVAAALVHQAIAAVGAGGGLAYVVSEDGLALEQLFAHGYRAGAAERYERIPLSAIAPGVEALRTRQAVHVESLEELGRRYPAFAVRGAARPLALTCMPLLGRGVPLGLVVVTWDGRHELGAEEHGLLSAIASQAAVALERAKLYEAAERSRLEAEAARRQAEALYRASDRIGRAADVDAACRTALEAIGELLGVERSAVLVADAVGSMRFTAWRGISDAYRAAVDGSRWPDDESDPRSIIVPDTEADARWSRYLPVFRAEGIRALAFVPLVDRGKLLGKLMLYARVPRAFGHGELLLVETLARHVAQVIARHRLAERERAARAEAEAERNNLRELFTQAPAAIAVLRGPELRYELSNPVNEAHAGNVGLVGKTVHDVFPELQEPGLLAAAKNVYQTGIPFSATEVPIDSPSPDGPKRKYVSGTFQPLRGADGRVEGVMGFAFDVTGQVEARREAEARAEELRFLADAVPQLVWASDAEGRLDFANQRCTAYTGLDVVGKSGEVWLSMFHPDEVEETTRRYSDALRGGTPFEHVYRLRRADGDFRWFIGRAVPRRDAAGRIVRWFGTATDIDDQVRAAGERERLLRDLEQAVQSRDSFLSVAGHELRTPITALKLHVQGLLRQAEERPGVAPERLAVRLGKAAATVARLHVLVDQLLDVSRIGSARLELYPEELELATLAGEVSERFADEAARLGSTLHLRTDGPVVGRWDRARLEQVLANLLSNAVKYGRGRPIELGVFASGDRAARITVRDQGIGIPEGARERLFGRFERAVSGRHYGGLGLGLWITRQLVEAHGGTISYESTEGEGTTFTVELPR